VPCFRGELAKERYKGRHRESMWHAPAHFNSSTHETSAGRHAFAVSAETTLVWQISRESMAPGGAGQSQATQQCGLALQRSPSPRGTPEGLTAQLSGRLTRGETLGRAQPSIAWPVRCSTWFGLPQERAVDPGGYLGNANTFSSSVGFSVNSR
jgi:hypothetical protein